MARSAAKRPKRQRGTVSSPCPVCGSNSRVTVTTRLEGVVIRTRRCVKNAAHVFKTKEVYASS